MLSYQHAYHAGNQADLHKHDALARLIAVLVRKPRPLTYMETHAGRGLYDLASPEARKTGEAALGIARVHLPPGPYAEAVEATRAAHGPDAYPGSPMIARHLLRPQDQMHLMELHPAEHAALKRALRRGTGGPRIAIHRRDGYEGVLALSPPLPRKGIVLVDPSYEVKTEYDTVPDFTRKLLARWPEATVLIWYPILPDARHSRMVAALARLPHQRHEASFNIGREKGMQGSGLVAINAPYGFDLQG